jgi:hypothetical protein
MVAHENKRKIITKYNIYVWRIRKIRFADLAKPWTPMAAEI